MSRFISRLYQYYRISSSFLFMALLARWAILFPLVGGRFLPGGIHKFLICLMVYAPLGEMVWLFKFRSFTGALLSRTMLKDMDFLYFVGVLHFYDDYEHSLVLKNIGYSVFIVTLALSQCYVHFTRLFKQTPLANGARPGGRSIVWKLYTVVVLPVLYVSQFNLLLLNVQNPNFHSNKWLDLVNKVILAIYIPVCLACFKKQWQQQ